jgi:hypothetical protein
MVLGGLSVTTPSPGRAQDASGPNDDSVPTQPEVSGVQEDPLPDLRLQHVHAEAFDHPAPVGFGHGRNRLDRVRPRKERQALGRLLSGQ